MDLQKVVWLVPEVRGGIRSYSEHLWPAMLKARFELEDSPIEFELYDPIYPVKSAESLDYWVGSLAEIQPDIIHIQHEYGLFGRKVPGRYKFPHLIAAIRKRIPYCTIIATAHTVLDPEFQYPLEGRGWQIPFRAMANTLLKPLFHQMWNRETWGLIDGTVVHSRLQCEVIERAGCPQVVVIPHYVYQKRSLPPRGEVHRHRVLHSFFKGKEQESLVKSWEQEDFKTVVVFGYITPEKGQLTAIQALKNLDPSVKLIMAGKPRVSSDQQYLKRCLDTARELQVADRVIWTGYLEDAWVDQMVSIADLVLSPFTSTSGSGSIPWAMSLGMPILTSDLPINCEMQERVHDCVATFERESPDSCATKIKELLEDADQKANLVRGARTYAHTYAPLPVAHMHFVFYRQLARRRYG